MRDKNEIQVAHDKLMGVLAANAAGRCDPAMPPQAVHLIRATVDVLCWVLEHPDSRMGEMLQVLDEDLARNGVVLKPNPAYHMKQQKGEGGQA